MLDRPPPLLVTITEYGASAAGYLDVLAELAQAPYKGREFLAVWGDTDLVTVDFHKGFRPFSVAEGGGETSFRRVTPAWVLPDEKFLPPTSGAVAIERVSPTAIFEPDLSRSFVAIAFFRMAPEARITEIIGPTLDDGAPLIVRAASTLAALPRQVQSEYRRLFARVEVMDSEARTAPAPRVAYLTGLDAADVVVFVRARRADQIGALLAAVSRVPLSAMASKGSRQGKKLAFSLPITLFGVPVSRHDDCWRVVPSDDDDAVAAVVGREVTRIRGSVREHATLSPTGGSAEAPLVRYFGQTDGVHDPGPTEIGSSEGARLTVGRLLGRVRAVLRPGHRQVRMSTDLGVFYGLTVGDAAAGSRAASDEIRALRRAMLRRVPKGERPTPPNWLARWYFAATEIGLHFDLTDAVGALIVAVVEGVASDLDTFVDLLPAIEVFLIQIERAADERPPDRDVHEVAQYYQLMQEVISSRGRRDHPHRYPGSSFAFEGVAGFRVARDAFRCLAHEVATRLALTVHLVVLDSPSRSPANFVLPDAVALRVSPHSLQHPLAWGAYLHELAEAAIELERRRARSEGTPYWPPALPDAAVALNRDLRAVVQSIDAISTFLRRSKWGIGSQFSRVDLVATEAAADVVAWYLLGRSGEPTATIAKRYWFLAGPAVLHSFARRHGTGGVRGKTISEVALRWFFVAFATEGEGEPNLRRALSAYLTMKPVGAKGRSAWLAAAVHRVRCLRKDALAHRDTSEHAEQLAADWKAVARGLSPLLAIYADALRAVGSRLQSGHGPAERRFSEFLDDLLAARPTDPWLRPRGEADETSLALDARGGLNIKDNQAKRDYHERSLQFLASLDDMGRNERYKRLKALLHSIKKTAPRSPKSETPPSTSPAPPPRAGTAAS